MVYKGLNIRKKIIPLSKSEAWRLYSQGNRIAEMKSLTSQMFLLNDGHNYSKFQDSNQIFALCLSEQESKEIEQPGNWRFLKVIVSIYSFLIGLVLFYFWYLNIFSPKFSPIELLIYSQICFLTSSYLIISILNSLKLENQALNEIYQKYQISDWKDLTS